MSSCAWMVCRCAATSAPNFDIPALIWSCFFFSVSKLLIIVRIAELDWPPPNARESSCDDCTASSPVSLMCCLQQADRADQPAGPHRLREGRQDRPIVASCFAAVADGAPSSEMDIRSRVAAICAGIPSSVISAIAPPTCFSDSPNVFAADRMPVPMAATKSLHRHVAGADDRVDRGGGLAEVLRAGDP